MMMHPNSRAQVEAEAFRERYPGGYFEGDPLDPLARSSFMDGGYMSILYACYLVCIRPYVNRNTTVLEIGPGRGAWTKCFIERQAREVVCLDAIPAERNQFWEYIGHSNNVRYLVVLDASLTQVRNDYFDYFFSFGVFCHLSPNVVSEYLNNLFPKMKSGANGFFLIADYDKYNQFLAHPEVYSVARALRDCYQGPELNELLQISPNTHFRPLFVRRKDEDDHIDPNRWYHLGVARAVKMVQDAGFEVVAEDVNVLHRDPILHFSKP